MRFRSVALLCLAHLQRNEAGAVAGENPEYVHQARVAISAPALCVSRPFAPVLAVDFVNVDSPRWRELAGGSVVHVTGTFFSPKR